MSPSLPSGSANARAGSDGSISAYLAEVTLYERETQVWEERRKKILKRYKDERSPREQKAPRFNVLWSIVQTLRPALYARTPRPDIQRRFKDADPVGRVASDVLERATTFFCESDRFDQCVMQSVMDYLLVGRGTAWVRYEPHLKAQEPAHKDGLDITDDADDAPGTVEIVDYEEVKADYVHADDFGHNICRTWDEVWLVWRKAYMDRAELVARFGRETGNRVPLDYHDKDIKDRDADSVRSKGTIYEGWDKKKKRAVWFHKDLPDALDTRDDPLGLEGFFPCPRPLATNLGNDSLIPTPDYIQWQDQAIELDNLTSRIGSIQKSLKVAGVYDASAQGLARLLAEGIENQLLPIEQWAVFGEKGGLKGAMDLLPLEDIAGALTALYEAKERAMQDLYEITGIADIIRGQSDPNETMGAQQIKSNFATLRLSDRQRDVERYVRDIVRLMVDIIANHFSLQTIKTISGVRLSTAQEKAQRLEPPPMGPSGPAPTAPQALAAAPPHPDTQSLTPDQIQTMLAEPSWDEVGALLRDRPLRAFRVDIETDSIIKADEEAEKAARIEFLQAPGGFLQQATGVVEQQPLMAPLAAQMLMFGVRAFRVGKELEGVFSATLQKIEQMVAARQGQQKPDPALVKAQGDMQLKQQELAVATQAEQAKLQSEERLSQMRLALEERLAQFRAGIESQRNERENQLEWARRDLEEQATSRLEQMKIEANARLEETLAHIRAAASIEVARITNKVTDGDIEEARQEAAVAAGEVLKPQIAAFHATLAELHGRLDGMAAVQATTPPEMPRAPDPDIRNLVGTVGALAQMHGEQGRRHDQIMDALTAERESEVERDPDTGRVVRMRTRARARGDV